MDSINDEMRAALIVLGHTQPSLTDQLYSYWNGKSSLGNEANLADHKENFLSSFDGQSVQEQEINWMKTRIGNLQIGTYQDIAYDFWSNGGMA
jgi:hypothetical protein